MIDFNGENGEPVVYRIIESKHYCINDAEIDDTLIYDANKNLISINRKVKFPPFPKLVNVRIEGVIEGVCNA